MRAFGPCPSHTARHRRGDAHDARGADRDLRPDDLGDAGGCRRHRQPAGTASAEHPIGTDHLGRDLLLRVLVATRLSLVLAIAATIVTVTSA